MITRKVTLHYPPNKTSEALVFRSINKYDLEIAIFRARITPEEGGYLSLAVSGEEDNIDRAFSFLRRLKVDIHSGTKGLHWNETRCTHCGACLVHCPTDALSLADTSTRTVAFDEESCVECLACIQACPFAACSSDF